MKLAILFAGLFSVAALGQVQPPAAPTPETITIVGPVVKPGTYTFKSGLTVLKILAISGGFERNANQKAVQIVRSRKPETIDIDVNAILKGKKADINLEPGDTVIVPTRKAAPTDQMTAEPSKTDFFTLPIA